VEPLPLLHRLLVSLPQFQKPRFARGFFYCVLQDQRSACPHFEASRQRSRRIFADTLTQDLPLVIEIVDSEEAINKFVDAIEGMMGSALVTTEKVKVIQYGTKRIE